MQAQKCECHLFSYWDQIQHCYIHPTAAIFIIQWTKTSSKRACLAQTGKFLRVKVFHSTNNNSDCRFCMCYWCKMQHWEPHTHKKNCYWLRMSGAQENNEATHRRKSELAQWSKVRIMLNLKNKMTSEVSEHCLERSNSELSGNEREVKLSSTKLI